MRCRNLERRQIATPHLRNVRKIFLKTVLFLLVIFPVKAILNPKEGLCMGLTYIAGDATNPQGTGTKIICHVCNDIFKWKSGFVVALSQKWPQPEAQYMGLQQSGKILLGTTQFVQIPNSDIYIANMIAQRGIKKKGAGKDDSPPIRYDALYSCLDEVAKFAVANNASIHGPRFGGDRAGGDWRVIQAIIRDILVNTYSLNVTIYDFPQPAAVPAMAQTQAAGSDDDEEDDLL